MTGSRRPPEVYCQRHILTNLFIVLIGRKYEAGQVETTIAFSEQLQVQWMGSLATYTVTNINNTGAGSLREAITLSNASVGVADTIEFAIAGIGPHTINLGSALPAITDRVTIDATSAAVELVARLCGLPALNLVDRRSNPALLELLRGKLSI